MKRQGLWIMADFSVAALVVVMVWITAYRLPRGGVVAVPFQNTMEVNKTNEAIQTTKQTTGGKKRQAVELMATDAAKRVALDAAKQAAAEYSATQETKQAAELMAVEAEIQTEQSTEPITANTTKQSSVLLTSNNGVSAKIQDWRTKFQDKFTDEVVAGERSYTSPNLSIELTYNHYDTGKLDACLSGKHRKYGTEVSYVLADIYVGDITCLQTAFAHNTYGVGYTERLSEMSKSLQAVLAVNGDSYSNNRHRNNGIIIRNGVVYRNQPTDSETCVLNYDGTMDIYAAGEARLEQLMERGAYQSWIFGPSLLDENGKAKDDFWTWDYIRCSHPRTAIGYFEPGHYCLLIVDGRQSGARGMLLDEMADVFETLGCKAAYNLDGGHCSFMTFQNRVANHPYKPEHEVTDGLFFTDGGLLMTN